MTNDLSSDAVMKVLHVLNEMTPSGAEVMLRVAARQWKEANIDVELIGLGSNLGEYAPSLSQAGYRIHHLPYASSLRFLIEFYRHIKKEQYDVVHLNSERANVRLGVTARLSGVRVVRSVHHPFPVEGFEGFRRKWGRKLLRAIGVKHISVSPTIEAWERGGLGNPTRQILNWYDADKFTPTTPESRAVAREVLALDPQTLVLVTVGNCRHYKNHPALLKALGSISQEIGFIYMHIGQEEASQPERALARDLGIEERVRFLGFQDDILPFLRAADIFVMPSLGEALGVAVIEALSTGLLAILADVPGIRDHRALSDEIIWVQPTPEALAEAIPRVASTPRAVLETKRLALGDSARARHGVDRGIRKYADVYRDER